MPTYDYACGLCGHEFEEFQSITARPLKKCPECGKNGLSRLIGTGAGVIFKGSGFYGTDYRGGSYSSDAKKDSESSSGEAKGGCAPTCGTSDAPAGCTMPKGKKAKKGSGD